MRGILNEPVVSPGGSFVFYVETQLNRTKFAQLTSALQITSGMVENALKLANPIYVLVDHNSECRGQYNCVNGVTAECGARFHDVYMGNSLVAYPKAAFKQLTHHQFKVEKQDESPYDMDLTISKDFKFVFPDELGMPIQKGHVTLDFVELVAHELAHGLGVHSNFEYVGFYAPQMAYYNGRNDNQPEIKFRKTLFDSHLYDNYGNSVATLVDEMNMGTSTAGMSFKTFKRNYRSMSQAKQIKYLNMMLVNKFGLFFKTKSNQRINVQAADRFGQYFSTSHLLLDKYSNTSDYLMTPTLPPLDNFLTYSKANQSWSTAPLGPNLIDILETLGYKRNPYPKRNLSLVGLHDDMRKARGQTQL
ncbi:hypothetical protein L0F63_006571 [Massospora cicadina]|nr:hypothetical protein L0F63_006571 [Massospora cicadina]